MTISDPIGDLLTRIRNGQQAGKPFIESPSSSLRTQVLKVLQEEGYISSYEVIGDEKKPVVRVKLKYTNDGPAIKEMKRVSTPGRRVYSHAKKIPFVYNGLGVNIVSTSQGVMVDAQAREKGIGGELLCTVY